ARQLMDRFIGKRAAAGHDADMAGQVDVPRHDADFAFARGDDAGTVGADQDRATAFHVLFHLDHVQHRNAFRDADDEVEIGVHRFHDGVRGKRRRDVEDGSGRAGGFLRFPDRVEHRQADRLAALEGNVHLGAALARRDAADHLRAVVEGALGVEQAGLAGDALRDHFRLLVHQDAHGFPPSASFTSATIFCAPSAIESAATILRPDSFRIFLPSSTLVPSSRTTSGRFSPSSLAAATTPSAMTSQRMMPPKMFTKMPFTFGSANMILNASVTFSFEAPPPTSRKLAGSPP